MGVRRSAASDETRLQTTSTRHTVACRVPSRTDVLVVVSSRTDLYGVVVVVDNDVVVVGVLDVVEIKDFLVVVVGTKIKKVILAVVVVVSSSSSLCHRRRRRC